MALHDRIKVEVPGHDHHAAPDKIDRSCQDRRDHDQGAQHRVHRVDERVGEQIERDVLAEERVREASRRAVQEEEQPLPIAHADREAEQECSERHQERYPAHQPAEIHARQLRHAFQKDVHAAEREFSLSGDQEVDIDQEKYDPAEREPGQELCGVGLGKDRFETDLAEELQVHDKGDELP